MGIKSYRKYKLIVIALMGGIIGGFTSRGNYLIPLIAFISGIIFLVYLRGKVTEIISDERDELIGGNAAKYTLTTVTIFTAGLSIVFTGIKKPPFDYLGMVFGLITMAILIIYAGFFYFFYKR